MSHKNVTVIQHVSFEDLGSFALPLRDAGFEIAYVNPDTDNIGGLGEAKTDLLIILGGPMGAHDEAEYPYLNAELNILTQRFAANLPTLGICLGAQLMARALGARVYAGSAKEIGWAQIQLTRAGLAGPLRHLDGHPVLHWHGDTFDRPEGCELLASTVLCPTQAFARGPKVLGLQFHPEVLAGNIGRWLRAYGGELTATGLSSSSIQRDTAMFGLDLESRAMALLRDWLAASS